MTNARSLKLAPSDYVCPFCDWLAGNETEEKRNSDIVLKTNEVTAFISPKWWLNNLGNVLVIPNKHYESLYDIPHQTLGNVYTVVQQVAIAMRETYQCDGISTRQHNESAGGQSIWHFHVHVFPRYHDDKLYQNHDQMRFATPIERATYAERLKTYLRKSE